MNRLRNLCWLLALAATLATGANASAANIWLSLNLEFNTLGDFSSGGTWKVVGKADARGIAGIALELTNANFNLNTGFLAPAIFYDLNDSSANPAVLQFDAAGFDLYGAFQSGQTETVTIQSDLQSARRFFDVGVIGGATQPGQNGTPAVLPGIASRQVPWGGYADDPMLALFGANPDLGSFTGGVEIATGTFNAGVVPGWGVAPELTGGNVWPSTTSLPAVGANILTTIRHVVPEPAALTMFTLGGLGIAAALRRANSAAS